MKQRILCCMVLLCGQVGLGQEKKEWPPEWMLGAWEIASWSRKDDGNELAKEVYKTGNRHRFVVITDTYWFDFIVGTNRAALVAWRLSGRTSNNVAAYFDLEPTVQRLGRPRVLFNAAAPHRTATSTARTRTAGQSSESTLELQLTSKASIFEELARNGGEVAEANVSEILKLFEPEAPPSGGFQIATRFSSGEARKAFAEWLASSSNDDSSDQEE